MENVCNILPSSIKSECDDFIEEYTPQIIQLLEEKLQPESLCKQIGLCSSVKVDKVSVKLLLYWDSSSIFQVLFYKLYFLSIWIYGGVYN